MHPEKKITYTYKNGSVDGIYYNAGSSSPLVIIVNGHNGFYNYGMFPYMQKTLYQNQISSYSFNYSHGGITGDNDYFDDLEKYEKNCMRLETEDLLYVLQNQATSFGKHTKMILLAHSLGGVPLIFGAQKAAELKISIEGIVLLSTVKTLNFWPVEMISEWAQAGVYYKKNNRTKQQLPQGFEFLQEVLKSDTKWNVERAIRSLSVPILIIHGEHDESVPAEHGQTLFEWIRGSNPAAEFALISNATHTYNTKHPFEGATPELAEMLKRVVGWVKNRKPGNAGLSVH